MRVDNKLHIVNIVYLQFKYRISGYLRVMFFYANSTLKPSIKSTQINISRNHRKSLNLPDFQETVSILRECLFHDSDIFANIVENRCTRKKTNIRYMRIMQSKSTKVVSETWRMESIFDFDVVNATIYIA